MSFTESYLRDAIFIDRESEPLYSSDQVFDGYPRQFATVSIQLVSTVLLNKSVDAIRAAKRLLPMFDDDGDFCSDGWYDYYISLNGYTKSHIDSCIEAVVCNSGDDDEGNSHMIELTEEEQEIIYRILDEQLKKEYGKGCEEMLREAEAEMEEDVAVSQLEDIVKEIFVSRNRKDDKQDSKQHDPVNHPSYYCGKIEVIDFIEDRKVGYHIGNAIKYLARAGIKDPSKEVEDLKKAIWYINRRIQLLEEENEGNQT